MTKKEVENDVRIHWHKICDSLNILHGIKIGKAKDDEVLTSELQEIETEITDNLIKIMILMKIDTKYK